MWNVWSKSKVYLPNPNKKWKKYVLEGQWALPKYQTQTIVRAVSTLG